VRLQAKISKLLPCSLNFFDLVGSSPTGC